MFRDSASSPWTCARDGDAGVEASVDVQYQRDSAFGVWVPAQMTERYRERIGSGERITSTSTYSNFRRYETSARVLSPAR